jgi:hypothetical protein
MHALSSRIHSRHKNRYGGHQPLAKWLLVICNVPVIGKPSQLWCWKHHFGLELLLLNSKIFNLRICKEFPVSWGHRKRPWQWQSVCERARCRRQRHRWRFQGPFDTPRISSWMSLLMRLTPPLRARSRIAGLGHGCRLSKPFCVSFTYLANQLFLLFRGQPLLLY